MSVTQISRIQHRRGLRVDLPSALHDAEFGWADNTRELFIGNGPLSPVGGNTQILTQVSPASLPNYSYISNTGALAVTGFDRSPLDPFAPNLNFPTIRSYQEKFDDYVSVLDYGAAGDGSDDTAAIRRACFDLYDERMAPDNDLRKFRVLYFPAGTYVITRELYLYPNAVWVGDGAGRTRILLANGGTLAVPVIPPFDCDPTTLSGGGDWCVVRTVDSLGQPDTNIGVDVGCGLPDIARPPGNIVVSGISFESETSHLNGYVLGQMDVIKLDDAKNVRFENCDFKGTWMSGFAANSRAIDVSNPGATIGPFGNHSFINCLFRNTGRGFEPTADTTNVYVVNSKFDTLKWGAVLGDGAALDVSLFRISHSIFESIQDLGFDVDTIGAGNISTYNHYRGIASGSIYSVTAVRFNAISTGAISLGDTFDTTSVFVCGDLSNTRVLNLSSGSIVMNAQDAFQVPNGFCGSIVLSGDITLDGCLISGKSSAVVVDDTTVIASEPYTPGIGGAIFFDFVMRVTAESVYRVGTLNVIHDGSGINIAGVNIAFSETYAETGGAPSQLIALEAEFNVGNQSIDVTVIDPLGAALTPTFKFLTRCINL